jgi:hypothetical protein
MLGIELTTMTVLRDPVERTLSYLHGAASKRDLSIEEVYEDPDHHARFVKDHQAKLFALTVADDPASYMHMIELDAERLALAKANLERVDVLGMQDHFEQMLGELETRMLTSHARNGSESQTSRWHGSLEIIEKLGF